MLRDSRRSRRLTALGLLFVLLMGAIAVSLARKVSDCVWPAQGKTTASASGFMVDYSHADQGYVMVKAPKSKKRQKVRIKSGQDQYTYDINGSGTYEVYPLQMGSGSYEALLYENKSGKQYAQKAKVTFKVKMSDENAAFLCPSQYVWYTAGSPAVSKSFELCASLTSDQEKLDAIRTFMKSYFIYDFIRATTQKDAYQGDVDGIFQKKKGLCLDFAAIMACMLRVQGIPTQLAVGQVSSSTGTITHAWNYVLINGEFVRVDITAEISGGRNSKYTVDKIY